MGYTQIQRMNKNVVERKQNNYRNDTTVMASYGSLTLIWWVEILNSSILNFYVCDLGKQVMEQYATLTEVWPKVESGFYVPIKSIEIWHYLEQ